MYTYPAIKEEMFQSVTSVTGPAVSNNECCFKKCYLPCCKCVQLLILIFIRGYPHELEAIPVTSNVAYARLKVTITRHVSVNVMAWFKHFLFDSSTQDGDKSRHVICCEAWYTYTDHTCSRRCIPTSSTDWRKYEISLLFSVFLLVCALKLIGWCWWWC